MSSLKNYCETCCVIPHRLHDASRNQNSNTFVSTKLATYKTHVIPVIHLEHCKCCHCQAGELCGRPAPLEMKLTENMRVMAPSSFL